MKVLLPAGREDTWMAMIRSRNLTSHTYNPELAHEIAAQILALLAGRPAMERVVLYGSRALGRQHSGSDVDLCLEAPEMGLAELLLPCPIDLQSSWNHDPSVS